MCETPVGGEPLSDTHYESDRVIFFCSPRHRDEYNALKEL
jgi:hypothetical protein